MWVSLNVVILVDACICILRGKRTATAIESGKKNKQHKKAASSIQSVSLLPMYSEYLSLYAYFFSCNSTHVTDTTLLFVNWPIVITTCRLVPHNTSPFIGTLFLAFSLALLDSGRVSV